MRRIPREVVCSYHNTKHTSGQTQQHTLTAPNATPNETAHTKAIGTASEPPQPPCSHDDDDDMMSTAGYTSTSTQPHPGRHIPTPQLSYSGYDNNRRYDGLSYRLTMQVRRRHQHEADAYAIEQLAHELIVSGDTDRSWAERWRWRWDLEPQVSIHPLIIPQHKPAVTCSWYPPQPPMSDYQSPGPTTHLPTPGTSPPTTTVSPIPCSRPTPTPHRTNSVFEKSTRSRDRVVFVYKTTRTSFQT